MSMKENPAIFRCQISGGFAVPDRVWQDNLMRRGVEKLAGAEQLPLSVEPARSFNRGWLRVRYFASANNTFPFVSGSKKAATAIIAYARPANRPIACPSGM